MRTLKLQKPGVACEIPVSEELSAFLVAKRREEKSTLTATFERHFGEITFDLERFEFTTIESISQTKEGVR